MGLLNICLISKYDTGYQCIFYSDLLIYADLAAKLFILLKKL